MGPPKKILESPKTNFFLALPICNLREKNIQHPLELI